jgi:hypothetical protein
MVMVCILHSAKFTVVWHGDDAGYSGLMQFWCGAGNGLQMILLATV